ncbi:MULTISPECIES: DNA-processing protein DprA [unclassified Vibrio]|uniref:DNA-processing protein DprA n=1 Tax=Vibrio sp. HB236076 TaxID=3232307 RepID=A0AB39HC77_9VIBR|nr:DNA-processing protein DprA [Vibrio sp. HB161653]MDP5255644.1 DNA-processing protein DprA [Vibrio sp. HB161653]
MRKELSPELVWLALSLLPKIGPQRLSSLWPTIPVQGCHLAVRADWLSWGISDAQYTRLDRVWQQAIRVEQWLADKPNRSMLTPWSLGYPRLLNEINSKPSVLFVEGDGSVLQQAQVAIVGGRHARPQALTLAQQWSRELAGQGLVITSGLAVGIDGFAHDGALKGGGKTIAVLGSGIDRIYPACHRGLAERIVESGALVSEFLPDSRPQAAYFPRRNRIISGLSLGAVIVEAAEKSGSLITARYALEQNREVMATPSFPGERVGAGCNRLIKQGAALVQCAQDILDEISPMLMWAPDIVEEQKKSPDDNQSLPFSSLLDNVKEEPLPIDIIASRSHIPVQQVMSQLLELELLGFVESVTGGYIRKRRG